MKCPTCGDDTAVCDSRLSNRVIGATRRRRRCLKCQERFTSIEVDYDEWNRREILLKHFEQVGKLFSGVMFPEFKRRRAPNKKGQK